MLRMSQMNTVDPQRVWTRRNAAAPRDGFCHADLGLPNGARRFDVDDNRCFQINEIVVGIEKKACLLSAPVHCAAGSERETNFGSTSLAAPMPPRQACRDTPAPNGALRLSADREAKLGRSIPLNPSCPPTSPGVEHAKKPETAFNRSLSTASLTSARNISNYFRNFSKFNAEAAEGRVLILGCYVVDEPNWQLGGSLIRGLMRFRLGPFAQLCLNEAFGFAVGFRRIGPGTDVFDLKSASGAREGKGFISRSIAPSEGFWRSHRASGQGPVKGL